MIGMSQIKKKFYTGLAAGIGVGLVGIIGISVYSAVTVNSYKKGTNKNYLDKYTKEVYVTNQTIIQGQTITNDMLTTTRVHINMIPSGALSSVGDNMVAKYSIGANMTITDEMIAEDLPDNDLRETELNTVVLPTNLVEGAYVDLRVQFPNGTDYVVIPELQVKQILNETVWFDLTEEQRALVNSAIVDTYLNEGAKLYCIEYVDQSQINYFNENNEEIIRGNLTSLIKSQLPELYSNDYSTTFNDNANIDNEFDEWNNDENIDNNINNNDDVSNSTLADEKAEIIYNFIKTYRNLVASTTSTAQTYQPTPIVMEMMKKDPNITNVAKDKLNEYVRQNIESRNNQIKVVKNSQETLEEEYEKLVEGAQNAINAQKEQRNAVMAVE